MKSFLKSYGITFRVSCYCSHHLWAGLVEWKCRALNSIFESQIQLLPLDQDCQNTDNADSVIGSVVSI